KHSQAARRSGLPPLLHIRDDRNEGHALVSGLAHVRLLCGGWSMAIQIFARNFRGFRQLSFTLDDTVFLVGDNSSGKTSILYLIDFVFNTNLKRPPLLTAEGVAANDFFSAY